MRFSVRLISSGTGSARRGYIARLISRIISCDWPHHSARISVQCTTPEGESARFSFLFFFSKIKIKMSTHVSSYMQSRRQVRSYPPPSHPFSFPSRFQYHDVVPPSALSGRHATPVEQLHTVHTTLQQLTLDVLIPPPFFLPRPCKVCCSTFTVMAAFLKMQCFLWFQDS